MNQNDTIKPETTKGLKITISSRLINLWRTWRIKRRLESIREYEDTVRDYRQDQ
jgi:hypothetical protein